MDFKIVEKKKGDWQKLMDEMEVESQMSKEAIKEREERLEAERLEKEKEHLLHLEKYHFKSAQEVIDYVYSGKTMVQSVGDEIKLMIDGLVGHLSTWLSEDDCCVLGRFWKVQTKESFEKWIHSCFEEHSDGLDNGYLPYWHKILDSCEI